MEQPERWQAADCELLWLDWDDGHVVYHGGSGDTHLLDVTAAGLLRRLQQTPAAPEELCATIAGSQGLASDEALGYTRELLAELERLALVERCP